MTIGILGRHEGLLERATALAARYGHTARGTTRDAEVLAWIAQRSIDVLIVGGGVEPAAMAPLTEAAERHGIRVRTVYGPGRLAEVLEAL